MSVYYVFPSKEPLNLIKQCILETGSFLLLYMAESLSELCPIFVSDEPGFLRFPNKVWKVRFGFFLLLLVK